MRPRSPEQSEDAESPRVSVPNVHWRRHNSAESVLRLHQRRPARLAEEPVWRGKTCEESPRPGLSQDIMPAMMPGVKGAATERKLQRCHHMGQGC